MGFVTRADRQHDDEVEMNVFVGFFELWEPIRPLEIATEKFGGYIEGIPVEIPQVVKPGELPQATTIRQTERAIPLHLSLLGIGLFVMSVVGDLHSSISGTDIESVLLILIFGLLTA